MLVKRMKEICDLLEREESVEIRTLSELLGVTEKTIRQDLIKLEEMGLLRRVRGGAVANRASNSMFPIDGRRRENLAEKERIAAAAAELVRDGDVVFLDNGTTTQALARLLMNRSIIIITNDADILHDLRDAESVTLYSMGGRLMRDPMVYSYVGPDTVRMVARHNIDIAFLGTSAISMEKGLMTFSEEEAAVKQAVVRVSRQVYCVSDSSKINKQAFVHIVDLKNLDGFITDAGIPETTKKTFEEGGLRVLTV